MSKKESTSQASQLRQRAEELLKDKTPLLGQSEYSDALRLVHELHVHQIELEMQNEELQAARIQTEQALARYTELYDFAPVGYLTLDKKGCILSINLTGALLLDQDRYLLNGNRLGLLLSLSSRPVFEEWLQHAFTAQDAHTCQLTLGDKGSQLRHIELRTDGYSPETPDECRTIMIDTTQRVHMEARLRQSEKMSTVGRMAGGIAHDFNNIVAAMMLNLSNVQHQCSDPEVKSTLETLEKLAERAADITRQLLLFSRKHEINPVSLEIDAVIYSNLKMIHPMISNHITVDYQSCPEKTWISADPSMLDQAIMNLLLNARDAMPVKGTLTIETRQVEFPVGASGLHAPAQPGTFLQIKIQDTGIGMDQSVLAHLFDPFFTTKDAGQGTGMGLTSVQSIITQHGGWITVESQPGQGSTFSIFLPVIDTKECSPAPPKPIPSQKGNQQMILLAEDEPAILGALEKNLTAAGYRVLAASNSAQALEHWEKHHHAIELLLTDVKMPGEMDGFDLARALARRKPSLHIIVMSGYYNKTAGEKRDLSFQYKFLSKPFKLNEMQVLIGECFSPH